MFSGDRLPPELDATADALNVAWNAIVRGEPIDAAVSPFAPTLRRLHALDDAPALTPERQARIWRDLMAAQGAGPALVLLPPMPPASPDGPAPGSGVVNAPAAQQRWPASFLATAAVLVLMLSSVLLTVGLWQPNRWLRTGDVPGVIADETIFHQRLDDIPAAANRVNVHRDTLSPGAVWEQGTRTTSGVGPTLYRVESGAVAVQAEGSFQVTRHGATLASAIPAGTTVDLAPGDVAFLPPGAASHWRNQAVHPATLLDA
ncbi:MAG TPA: hypothetical protein VFU81_13815, partial [Thermomicrobiales bacterium]|nr:hypothetical protein [Thermomicrobiales bacterium]